MITHRAGRPRATNSSDCVKSGEIDTIIVAITDMQGRLQGKRLDARVLLRRAGRRRRRGLQLPARLRRRHAHGRRIRPDLVGARLRRPRLQARLSSTSDSCPGTKRRSSSSPTSRPVEGEPVAPSPRQILQPRSSGSPSAAGPASPAPNSSSSSSRTPTRRPGTPGYRDLTPVNQYNVDYSIQGTLAHRAAARTHPPLDARRPGWSSSRLKGECNFGQHEIAFKYDDACRQVRRAQPVQARRQGDRRPGGRAASPSWPSTTNARATPVTSTSRCATKDTARLRRSTANTASPRSSSTSSRVCSPTRASSRSSSPRTSTATSASSRDPSRRRRCSGALTTARARFASSATARRSRVECRIPGGDVNPYLAIAALVAAGLQRRRGEHSTLPPAFEGNAYDADAPRVPTTLREATALFDQSLVARDGLRRRGGRPLRARRRASRSTRSTPRSPTGSATGASNDCEHARWHHQPRDREADRRRSSCTTSKRPTPRHRARRRHGALRGATSRPRTAHGCCGASPTSSTRTSKSSRSSRSPTPATPSPTPAGRPATSATSSRTTPARRNVTPAGRFPSPAASTSPSTSRSASSGIIVPWNFPMPIAGWGLRPGARGRQHGRLEAGDAHAADGAAPRRTRPSRRACPRASSRSCPATAPWSAGASSRTRPSARSVSPVRARSARR